MPASEEFLRVDIADQQIFFPTGWSQLGSPFGRTTQVYQRRQIERRDTSETSLYVTRGRGAFSNTIFRFQNYFGPSFNLSADGNFQQNTGLFLLADHKLDRLRFVAEPNVGERSSLAVAFQSSRLKGSKLFFPGGYQYRGNYSDNYSALAIIGDRVTSPGVSYRLRAAYKNDDQKFSSTGLSSAQRFRLLDLSLAHQRPLANQTVELGLDLRICDSRTGTRAMISSTSILLLQIGGQLPVRFLSLDKRLFVVPMILSRSLPSPASPTLSLLRHFQ